MALAELPPLPWIDQNKAVVFATDDGADGLAQCGNTSHARQWTLLPRGPSECLPSFAGGKVPAGKVSGGTMSGLD
jgi:hypothetical protein